MSIQTNLSSSDNATTRTKTSRLLGLSGTGFTIIVTFIALNFSIIYVFAPRLIRKYASNFKIGQVGFFSLSDLEWRGHRVWVKGKGMVMKSESTSELEESGVGERTKVTVGFVGIRFGSNEGSRRQWIALRVDSIRIRVPKAHLEPHLPDGLSDESDDEVTDRHFPHEFSRTRRSSGASATSPGFRSPDNDPTWLNLFKDFMQNLRELARSMVRHLPPQLRPALRLLLKSWRFVRLKVVRPLLNILNKVGRRLSWVISVFGLEINGIDVEVDGICRVKCGIKIGFQLSRGENSQVCCWMTMKKLQIDKACASDVPELCQAKDTRVSPGGDETPTAFSSPGCIEFSASAGLDPVLGLASIMASRKPPGSFQRAPSTHYTEPELDTGRRYWRQLIRPHSVNISLKFSETPQNKRRSARMSGLPESFNVRGVYLSVQKILDIADSLPHQTTAKQPSPPSSFGRPTRSLSHEFSGSQSENSSKFKVSFVSILRQLQVEIPSLKCHYLLSRPVLLPTTCSSATPSGSTATSIETVSSSLEMSGFMLDLDLSEDKTGKDSRRSAAHIEWFGRGAPIPLRFNSRWKEVKISASMLSESGGSLASIHNKPSQLLQISETSFMLSSSWIPGTLRDKFVFHKYFSSSASHLSFTGDHNDHMVVAEFEIGKIKGQMPIDNFTIMHALFSRKSTTPSGSRADPVATHQPTRDQAASQSDTTLSYQRKELPRIIVGVTVQAISCDLYGPAKPGPSAFGPGSATDIGDEHNNVWRDSDVLSFGCSAFHFNATSEYVNLTVKRTDAARRDARTKARRNEVFVPQSLRSVTISKAHENAILNERHAGDTDSASAHKNKDVVSSGHLLEAQNEGPNKITAGLYSQAYPLPNPSAISHWKSRAEIFREMSWVHFLYQISFTWTTSSIDLIFQDGRRSDNVDASMDRSPRTLPSLQYECLSLTSIRVASDFCFAGWDAFLLCDDLLPIVDLSLREGSVQISIGEIALDLWRPNVMSSLLYLMQNLSVFRPSKPRKEISRSNSRTKPIPQDIAFSIAICRFGFRSAGFDAKHDPNLARGTKLEICNLLIESFRQSTAQSGLYSSPNRLRLDLKEDIRVQANAKLLQNPEFDSCLIKCAVDFIAILSVPDATDSLRHHRLPRQKAPNDLPQTRHLAPSQWEFKSRFGSSFSLKELDQGVRTTTLDNERDTAIMAINRLTCRMTLQTLEEASNIAEDELIVAIETGLIQFHIDAFRIYCTLMSISALSGLMKKHSASNPEISNRSTPEISHKLHLGVRAEISNINLHIYLSHQVTIFIELRRLAFQKSQKLGVDVRWDTFLLAGQSVTCPGLWDDILKIKTCKIKIVEINPTNSSSDFGPVNRGWHPFIVIIEGDAARLRIPFKFIIAEVIESISILVKTTKQLYHQFIRGGYGSILQPVAENPKKLPEIRIKFRIVVVQAEDDPFENKLNAIRRAGKEEVKERLARDESFEQKVQVMKAASKYSPANNTRNRYSWESQAASAQGSTGSRGDEDTSSLSSSFLSQAAGSNPQVPIGEAAQRLEEYNAAAWIKRIRNAVAEQERHEDAIQRQLYGHTTTKLSDSLPIDMIHATKATPLVRVVFNSIQISLYKADFEKNENGLMEYLHRVGKGLPKDTNFSLIVPMHISWQMEGASIKLRDFPLHLFSLPRPQAQNGDQQERDLNRYTWQFESDFVIAEEMCGVESIFTIPSLIVPRIHSAEGRPYVLDVPKGVMPVKSYADPVIKVKSTAPLRLGWGNSMQPTIQDMMRVLDSISKPPVDPSERVGFWDKVRLVLHWMVDITIVGNKADVVLHLKGSRDPYELLGSGAGFAKVWRGNVKLLIGHPNEDQEFLQIKSDQYILGIPNLKDHINNAATGSAPVAAATPAASYKRVYQEAAHSSDSDESESDVLSSRETEFIKVVGKLTNGVRWGMGIVLERACDDGKEKTCNCHGSPFHRKCRIFTFKPHYEVVTKTSQYAISPAGEASDSYAAFRSDFIHFSISLTSPTEGGHRQKRPSGQNSLYFSSEAFTHFWSWWKTFDSALSLPIRQGDLFPSAQSASKKFGRHVATIKYRFSISPLFLAHTYKYDNTSDWVHGKSAVLGFKAKISKFNVDLHARAIETTIRKPEMKEPQKLIHKAFYQAEIDCQDMEIRAISAVFQIARKATLASEIGLTADQDDSEANSILEDHANEGDDFMFDLPSGGGADPSYSRKFQAQDEEWIDLDDFSDVFFWPSSNTGRPPKIKLFNCVSCPRIVFLRRPSSAAGLQPPQSHANASILDWESATDEQPVERTKFGKEDTHTCFIGKVEDPMMVQVGLLDSRLQQLEQEKYRCIFETASPHVLRPEDSIRLQQIEARMQTLRELRASMLSVRGSVKRQSTANGESRQGDAPPDSSCRWDDGERYLFEMAKQIADENSEWSNRLLVHNPSILISNSIRDILLKYYYSYSQRRAFIYHISARAVKFILDLADQNSMPNKPKPDSSKRKSRIRSFDLRNFDDKTPSSPLDPKSMHKFPEEGPTPPPVNLSAEEQAEQDIPDDFIVDPADLVLLMRPQIAFRSEIDDVSTVILTAFHAQLKSFEVLDSSQIDDPVNAKVMRRNFGTIRGFQMFYPSNPSSTSSSYPNSEPFGNQCLVPVEVLVDLRLEPWGFDRLIGRCTVDITHDTFNQLRIKRRSADADWSFSTATQPHLQTSTDLIRVETADAVSVHATATHYRAIYNVITDLCFYIDPAQKKRNAALETMQFAYDVEDLAGMAVQIQQQQERIRLYRSRLVEDYVDLNVFDEDRMAELTHREYQLWQHASDLNLMVEAIRRSQASSLGRSKAEKLPGSQMLTHAKVITWYMLADSGEAIAKLSITDTRFESYTLPDTSVSNRLYVQDMLALNISADNDRQFDEILSRYEPYNALGPVEGPKQFLMVLWKTLPPIAGISIIESFLLEIHPIRLQIEHAIGVKVHEYLFARKVSGTADEEESSEQHDGMESPILPSHSDTKKARKSRSMTFAKHQKIRLPIPAMADDRHSIFKDSDSLASPRLRTVEAAGFLNTDWRSPIGSGQTTVVNSSRASLAPSVYSNSSDGRRGAGANATPTVLLNWNKQKTEDATEMKKRSQLYKSFIFIDVVPTILCVSYSGPKYPDIFDLVVKVPPFHFESRTWSYSEFFDEIRRACVSSLFKQSPSILGQIITTARKNKSVPKIMGQKMALGLKLKKMAFFERGNSLTRSQPNSLITDSSSNSHNTESPHPLSRSTSKFEGSPRSPHLPYQTSPPTSPPFSTYHSSFGQATSIGNLPSEGMSGKDSTSRPSLFRIPHSSSTNKHSFPSVRKDIGTDNSVREQTAHSFSPTSATRLESPAASGHSQEGMEYMGFPKTGNGGNQTEQVADHRSIRRRSSLMKPPSSAFGKDDGHPPVRRRLQSEGSQGSRLALSRSTEDIPAIPPIPTMFQNPRAQ